MDPLTHPRHNPRRVSLLFLLSAAGLSAFMIASVMIPTTNNLFRKLFPKAESNAAEYAKVPVVDVKLVYEEKESDGILNINPETEGIGLRWSVQGNNVVCAGRSWTLGEKIREWEGPKEGSEGFMVIPPLPEVGPYVFSLDCSNESGDAVGDSVTINVGAQSTANAPYLTKFDISSNETLIDISRSPVFVSEPELNVLWASLNTGTPFSICIASGSWPAQYQMFGHNEIKQTVTMKGSKLHALTIFCSNEHSSTQQSVILQLN